MLLNNKHALSTEPMSRHEKLKKTKEHKEKIQTSFLFPPLPRFSPFLDTPYPAPKTKLYT
jgi:hypothetical protein